MSITGEILQYNYWEHFKKAKDISLIYPPEHPKRIELQKNIDELLAKINSKVSEETNY